MFGELVLPVLVSSQCNHVEVRTGLHVCTSALFRSYSDAPAYDSQLLSDSVI